MKNCHCAVTTFTLLTIVLVLSPLDVAFLVAANLLTGDWSLYGLGACRYVYMEILGCLIGVYGIKES